jgi:hypothetical protein
MSPKEAFEAAMKRAASAIGEATSDELRRIRDIAERNTLEALLFYAATWIEPASRDLPFQCDPEMQPFKDRNAGPSGLLALVSEPTSFVIVDGSDGPSFHACRRYDPSADFAPNPRSPPWIERLPADPRHVLIAIQLPEALFDYTADHLPENDGTREAIATLRAAATKLKEARHPPP